MPDPFKLQPDVTTQDGAVMEFKTAPPEEPKKKALAVLTVATALSEGVRQPERSLADTLEGMWGRIDRAEGTDASERRAGLPSKPKRSDLPPINHQARYRLLARSKKLSNGKKAT